MNKLYLDLDGVFADFNSAVKELIGKYPGEIDRKTLWINVQKVPNFYYNLKLMGNAKESFDYIINNSIVPVEILTALPSPAKYLRTSAADKQQWVYDNLSKDIVTHCVVNWREKANFAKENNVLVDDQFKNISAWNNNGGIGIHHHSFLATINLLEKHGIVK